MPADAVHLAALHDSHPGVSQRHLDAARLGALFVDLPYYERFYVALAAHLVGVTLSWSRWGDRFHNHAPIGFACALAKRVRALSHDKATRADAAWLEAFLLGYVSHAAVDRKLHPLVNQLAAQRKERHSRAHQEVEKLQSLLFHRERFGHEMLGRQELSAYLSIDASPLWSSKVISHALHDAALETFGHAPTRSQLQRWSGGYASYVRLLSSRFGRRVVSDETLEEQRATVYTGPHFVRRFDDAATYARRCMEAARALAHGQGRGGHPLLRVLPEGTLDPQGDSAVL